MVCENILVGRKPVAGMLIVVLLRHDVCSMEEKLLENDEEDVLHAVRQLSSAYVEWNGRQV